MLRTLKTYFNNKPYKYSICTQAALLCATRPRWFSKEDGVYIYAVLCCCCTSIYSFKVILTFQPHSITFENSSLYDHGGTGASEEWEDQKWKEGEAAHGTTVPGLQTALNPLQRATMWAFCLLLHLDKEKRHTHMHKQLHTHICRRRQIYTHIPEV